MPPSIIKRVNGTYPSVVIYTRNDNEGYREGDVYTKNVTKNTITRFPSAGERSFDRYNYAGRLSASYTADAHNMISAGFYSVSVTRHA